MLGRSRTGLSLRRSRSAAAVSQAKTNPKANQSQAMPLSKAKTKPCQAMPSKAQHSTGKHYQ